MSSYLDCRNLEVKPGADLEPSTWEGSPSHKLLMATALRWGFGLLIVIAFARSAPLLVVGVLLAALRLGVRWWTLQNTIYRLTNERLEIVTGLFARHVESDWLIICGTVSIHSRFPLSSLGLSNLHIETGDESRSFSIAASVWRLLGSGQLSDENPVAVLEGIQNAREVCERIVASKVAAAAMWDRL